MDLLRTCRRHNKGRALYFKKLKHLKQKIKCQMFKFLAKSIFTCLTDDKFAKFYRRSRLALTKQQSYNLPKQIPIFNQLGFV